MRINTSLWQKIKLVFFGFFLCLIVLEIGLRAGGFILLSVQKYKNSQQIKNPGGVVRILCLGESTTFLGGESSWPSQLEYILNNRKPGIRFSVINGAVPAVNTDFIISHLDENLNQYRPNIVIAMMGANDGRSDGVRHKNRFGLRILQYVRSLRVYKMAGFLKNKFIVMRKIAINQQNGILEEKEAYAQLLTGRRFKDDKKYIESGWDYRNQGRYDEAEKMFRKAIAVNPRNERAYIGLADQYLLRRESIEAERIYKEAIRKSPDSYEGYFSLGWCYRYYQRRPYEASEAFNKALEINPAMYRAYFELGGIYFLQKDYMQAQKYIQMATVIDPQAEAFGLLAQIYLAQGKDDLSGKYFNKANKRRVENYNPITMRNYNELRKRALKRRIHLFCMQYPVRSIDSLRGLFANSEGVIFVDNESIFKEAVSRQDYNKYFGDVYGGDFGHCTPEGNRLLAANAADIILREY